MDPEKLSRVTALRPAAQTRRPSAQIHPASRSNSQRLAELLGAECRCTPVGCHLAARHRYPEPKAIEAGSRALRLLLPRGPDLARSPENWLFLDTETTGLSGGTGTYAFMVGLAWWDQSGFTAEQLFMRDHSEEPSLLHELSSFLAQRPVLITFNGKSFDWPLLETRFRMARVRSFSPPQAHIDLLHPSRQLWRYRLPSVALSEIERHVLELERSHDIPSETIPGRYFDFLRGGPAEPVAEVFRHNLMDLRGLAALAAHITRLLDQAETANCEATELFGMSRLLQRRGEIPLAGLFFERALAEGLSEAPGSVARRELALLAKRNRDYNRANRLWQELLGSASYGLEAYEHLAMYYEHEARDYERAVRLTRDALVELREALGRSQISPHQFRRWHAGLQHRLERLCRKLAGSRRQKSALDPGDSPLKDE